MPVLDVHCVSCLRCFQSVVWFLIVLWIVNKPGSDLNEHSAQKHQNAFKIMRCTKWAKCAKEPRDCSRTTALNEQAVCKTKTEAHPSSTRKQRCTERTTYCPHVQTKVHSKNTAHSWNKRCTDEFTHCIQRAMLMQKNEVHSTDKVCTKIKVYWDNKVLSSHQAF